LAHHLAWETFVGPIPEGHAVLHKCDTSSCCNPEHLFTGTQKDNMRDMIEKGRRANFQGSRHGMAKLDEKAVGEIRRRRAAGESTRALAVEYGVNPRHLRDVIAGRLWRHVVET
jgi:hypothetical protein